jgi:hypothetical protein
MNSANIMVQSRKPENLAYYLMCFCLMFGNLCVKIISIGTYRYHFSLSLVLIYSEYKSVLGSISAASVSNFSTTQSTSNVTCGLTQVKTKYPTVATRIQIITPQELAIN